VCMCSQNSTHVEVSMLRSAYVSKNHAEGNGSPIALS
jgi:hypothetical protein